MKVLSPALKLLVILFAGLLSAVLLAVCVGIGVFFYFDAQLPAAPDAAGFQLSEPLRVYTADGRLMRKYGSEFRLPVTYEQIPDKLVNAFVAAEDDRFFEHPGVDYQGIVRAVFNVVTTGTKSQGGSTITMQLARNLYLSSKRTYVRKIKEIILALRLESRLSKQQILDLYLNKIYLGSGAYGVGAAAKVYYDKTVSELTLAQAAMIAGLPKAPTTYSPLNNPQRARERRAYVLGRMLDTNKISQAEYKKAMAQPIHVTPPTVREPRFKADYVAEMVRQKMLDRYGDAAYTGGYNVYTTITSQRQHAAMLAVRHGLVAYDARHKWRGAQTTVPTDLLTDSSALHKALAQLPQAGWLVPAAVLAVQGDHIKVQTANDGEVDISAAANPWLKSGGKAADMVSPGDVVRLLHDKDAKTPWRLAQIPQAQSALVSLNPETGAVEALVGGFDFNRSKFNRAIDAYRQPGSSIKPFIYAAALANGFTAATLINDAPVVYGVYAKDKKDQWRPRNYGHDINGPTRLREGVVHSRNLMTIRLLRAVGIKKAIDYLARFGLPRDRMPHDLTLALGSATFTPMQMATGYAVMANGGYRVKPHLIEKITDNNGDVIYKADPEVACQKAQGCAQLALPDVDDSASTASTQGDDAQSDHAGEANAQTQTQPKLAPRVITADNAYIIGDIMRDVINRGTGVRARSLGRHDLSGKTGTSNDTTNAWFVGFDERLVAVVWVGFDSPSTLGWRETGAHAALPIWVDYMGKALKGVPESIMPKPDNIMTVLINPETGQRALNGKGMDEIFKRGTQPTVKDAQSYHGFDPSQSPDRLF